MPKKLIRKETILSHGLEEREPKGKKGIIVCKICGNSYFDKEWFDKGHLFKIPYQKSELKYAICPACEKTKNGSWEGIIKLSGEFLSLHKQDIINLLRGVEKRQLKNKPLNRIIDITEDKGQLVITTTCKELALAIGKELKRAMKGDLKIKWTKDEDLVRIEWSRVK